MTQNENFNAGKTESKGKYEIAYFSVFLIVYFHLAGFYGFYLVFTKAKWITLIYTCVVYLVSAVGVVVGAHKLWSHRAFKASRILQLFLMLAHSMAFQFTVHRWVKFHRIHHQHSDTSSDPHDASRGLFYSHIGWLMIRRPVPASILARINMEDIEGNAVLNFQKRHAIWLLPTAAFIIPSILPLLWSEDFSTSWHLNQLRFIIGLNLTSAVNSFSHSWGSKPYDNGIRASQMWPFTWLTLGEGYHNFHHAFPFDYRASEKGWPNAMAGIVDVCAKVGLAYDLREASEESVKMRKEKTGDGSGRNGQGLDRPCLCDETAN